MRFSGHGWVGLAALALLSACGGGGGSGPLPGPGGGNNPPPSTGYTPGVFQPSSTFANQCSSTTTQNHFLRSWTNELYLWYDEVPDLNPSSVADPLDYFDELRTDALTASGQPKDKFHFTYDTDDWIALSQSGVSAGYGVQWIVMSGTPPREIVVAFTEPGTPATAAGLERGDRIMRVDGQDAVNGTSDAVIDALNAGVYPSDVGQTHSFSILKRSGQTVDLSMTSQEITSDPVQNVTTIQTPSGLVGYLLFNDHIATAESELVNAIQTLDAAGVQDLVLDIRYNGGGYLDLASELAYMIAGSANTAGRTFEQVRFNNKHPVTNPVTGQPLAPTPFHSTTQGFPGGGPAGVSLPTLELNRVYVLTSGSTCSASEAIMNALRGVDVHVYQVGTTTCGKPYGFYPEDNCGTTYFAIQFQGQNDKGFADYSDGFVPSSSASGTDGFSVPGCVIADDFTRALGDPLEAQLAAALAYRDSNNQTCPAASSLGPDGQFKSSGPVREGYMIRSPLRENRIMRRM
jgi:C-terminal processing protease CtpA/Prc